MLVLFCRKVSGLLGDASVIRRLHLPIQTKFYLCGLCCLYNSLKAIFGHTV